MTFLLQVQHIIISYEKQFTSVKKQVVLVQLFGDFKLIRSGHTLNANHFYEAVSAMFCTFVYLSLLSPSRL